jgi:hypothetical protein
MFREFSDFSLVGHFTLVVFGVSVKTSPGAHPLSCTTDMGRGLKQPGHGVNHPPLSNVKVKERVEL